MRLVCPNCDAEYEVDASVIPEAGRDVQCSSCGYAWFQTSLTQDAAVAEEAALFDAPLEAPATAEPEPPEAPAPQPRGLDETVLAVLREEAERETAARRSEAAPALETQTELGLIAAAPVEPAPMSAAARRVAQLKGTDPEPRPVPRPQTRREMLPAIEEINSTLRATSEKRSGEQALLPVPVAAERARSGGFRNGFILMLLIAAIGLLAYVMAPRIGQQIPGAAPAMTVYVAAVDTARLWLDGLLQQAITALRGLSGNGAA
ncbi:MAG: zinc-ribbon domain-containing protein [Paracoccaceae bacterium]